MMMVVVIVSFFLHMPICIFNATHNAHQQPNRYKHRYIEIVVVVCIYYTQKIVVIIVVEEKNEIIVCTFSHNLPLCRSFFF